MNRQVDDKCWSVKNKVKKERKNTTNAMIIFGCKIHSLFLSKENQLPSSKMISFLVMNVKK